MNSIKGRLVRLCKNVLHVSVWDECSVWYWLYPYMSVVCMAHLLSCLMNVRRNVGAWTNLCITALGLPHYTGTLWHENHLKYNTRSLNVHCAQHKIGVVPFHHWFRPFTVHLEENQWHLMALNLLSFPFPLHIPLHHPPFLFKDPHTTDVLVQI